MQEENIYNKIKSSAAFKKKVSTAERVYEYKPFADEYYPLFILARILSPLMSFVSVAGGAAFLYINLTRNVHWLVSLILSVLLIAMLELAKYFITNIALRKSYIANRLQPIFALSIVLFCLSVYLSLSGVKEIYMQLNTEKHEIQSDFSMKKDSVNAYYSNQISLVISEKSENRKMKDWRNGDKIGAIIAKLDTRQDSLEADRKRALYEIGQLTTTQVSQAEKRADFDTYFWIAMASIVEVLIILSIWFALHYHWMTRSESQVIEDMSNQSFNISLTELQSFTHSLLLNKNTERLTLPIGDAKRQVGFQSNSLDSTRENQENASFSNTQSDSVKKDYRALDKDIKNGVRDYRTLMKDHKVNATQVKERITKFENK